MENNKILDFSSLESLDIPEIKEETTQTSTEQVETTEETSTHQIEEVDSIDSLEDDNNDDPNRSEEPGTQTSTTTSEEEPDPALTLVQWGHDLGILDYSEEDYQKYEDKEEYFKDKFLEKAKELGTESLPPIIKQLAEKYVDGVPLDELIGSMSNQQRLENIDDKSLEDDTRLQEELVSQYLALQDYEPDEIKAKLTKYKDSLLLEDEAKTALKKLKKYEQTYQQQLEQQAVKERETQQQQYTKQIKALEETIRKTESFIPGLTMDSKTKEVLYNSITKRDREGKTELQKRMESEEMQLAVAQFVMQLDGKIDAVARKVTTQVSKKVKDVVDNNTTSTNNSKTRSIDMSVIREAIKKSKPKF